MTTPFNVGVIPHFTHSLLVGKSQKSRGVIVFLFFLSSVKVVCFDLFMGLTIRKNGTAPLSSFHIFPSGCFASLSSNLWILIVLDNWNTNWYFYSLNVEWIFLLHSVCIFSAVFLAFVTALNVVFCFWPHLEKVCPRIVITNGCSNQC